MMKQALRATVFASVLCVILAATIKPSRPPGSSILSLITGQKFQKPVPAGNPGIKCAKDRCLEEVTNSTKLLNSSAEVPKVDVTPVVAEEVKPSEPDVKVPTDSTKPLNSPAEVPKVVDVPKLLNSPAEVPKVVDVPKLLNSSAEVPKVVDVPVVEKVVTQGCLYDSVIAGSEVKQLPNSLPEAGKIEEIIPIVAEVAKAEVITTALPPVPPVVPLSSVSPINKSKIGDKVQVKEEEEEEEEEEDGGEDSKLLKNKKEMTTYLAEPIDQATKLLMDLEEQVKTYLDDDVVNATHDSAQSYGAKNSIEELPDTFERQAQQLEALVNEVNGLTNSLEGTITDLVSRRRYVTAAMMRSMLNYLRRVRISLERLQNRLGALQAAATSGSGSAASGGAAASPGAEPGTGGIPGYPGAQFFVGIRDRINQITQEVGSLMTRIRASFSPTPVPSNPSPSLF